MDHALACKDGGLVVGKHDGIKDELAELATLATSSNRVRDEPLVKIGRNTEGTDVLTHASFDCSKPNPPTEKEKDLLRGDVLIHGLYDRNTSCIIDVQVTDTDQPFYLSTTPQKALKIGEGTKKKKYLSAYLEQGRHFPPYVVDCYGLLDEEAKASNRRIRSKLAEKLKSPYLAVMGFVNDRVSIAILGATHLRL